MSNYTGINLYINNIINALKTSDNLMRLIYYCTPDALSPSKPNLTETQKNGLIKTKIFPYRFIPNISTEASTYINLEFDKFVEEKNNPYCQVGKIVIFINCHKTLWDTYNGLRPILIYEELVKLFKGKIMNIGMLKLVDMGSSSYDDNLCGYYMVFSTRAVYE